MQVLVVAVFRPGTVLHASPGVRVADGLSVGVGECPDAGGVDGDCFSQRRQGLAGTVGDTREALFEEQLVVGPPRGEATEGALGGNLAWEAAHIPDFCVFRNPDTVRAPDVAWISPGRVPEGTRGYPDLSPDLAVEVKSPGNSYAELADKAAMWLSHGSREVWVADPEHTNLTVYRPGVVPIVLGEDDDIDGDELLPGFTSPVWRLFRRRR